MNIPNILTLSRIVLAVVMVFLLEEHSLTGYIGAAIAFAIASVTDFCDGYVAKTMGLISDFGKIMDPIADKVLLLSAFGVLADIGMVAWWMFIVIAVREISVTVSRLLAMRHGQVLAAERAGKIKTVVQITAVAANLLYLISQHFDWFDHVQSTWLGLNDFLMLAAVVLTVYSGIEYFRHKGGK